jgi:flavin reductase (DIM6/NTAB) family NADH-FMN oxidoreductase RutF
MTERAKQPLLPCEPDARLPNPSWVVNSGAEADAFRLAMRRVVGGVTVITTRHADQPWGMTVSAFTPVCMDPPTLLVCVNNRTVTASDISHNGLFAVNLLSQAQLHVSQLCARAGRDKYLTDHIVPPNELPDRVVMPVLRNSIVTFDCKAIEIRPVGSHLVVIATIEAVLAPEARAPLLYGEGRYLHGVAIDDLSAIEGAQA